MVMNPQGYIYKLEQEAGNIKTKISTLIADSRGIKEDLVKQEIYNLLSEEHAKLKRIYVRIYEVHRKMA